MTEKPLITEPLTVDLVGEVIVVDGNPQVMVSMTPEAAIETGIRLVNAGIGIDEDSPAAPPGPPAHR